MKPKISVLIPTYQVEKYLKRCLDSVLAQTYPNIEIVIVDDGSTDQTANIIRAYEKKFSNIYSYFELHQGLSRIRNVLLDNCTGDYLFFLDSDDFLMPESLEIFMNTALKYQADIVQCRMDWTSKDTVEDTNAYGMIIYSRDEALRAYNRSEDGPRCMAIAKLYAKEVFSGIRYPMDHQTQEDEYEAFYLLDNCHRFVALKQKLYGYFCNPDSIMRRTFDLAQYEVLPAVEDSLVFYKQKKMYAQVNRIRFRYLTLIRELYTNTAKYLPNEKKLMDEILKKYRDNLQVVLENSKLSQELVEDFREWGNQPLSVESYNYWHYVRNNMLLE